MRSHTSNDQPAAVGSATLRWMTLAVAVAFAQASLADQASIQGIGFRPGDEPRSSRATGVSGDGLVVVGSSVASGERRAVRWTAANGLVELSGSLGYWSETTATNADGSVVVGSVRLAPGSPSEGFRWTSETGMELLGPVPGGLYTGVYPMACTGDGSVIVGSCGTNFGPSEAFRWTAATGIVLLGDLPGSVTNSIAFGVSADGNVVVGLGKSSPSSIAEAARWVISDGTIEPLGFLPGGTWSVALGVSADGGVIVGVATSGSSAEIAVRWTAAGIERLDDLPPDAQSPRSSADVVNSDGRVIAGYQVLAGAERATIWTPIDGTRLMDDLLTKYYRISLNGWKLEDPNGISADGLTIVGRGRNAQGVDEGWVVRLPVSVPADVNCDRAIDFFDIDPFLLALFDPTTYPQVYPACDMMAADVNDDGLVDNFDIDPFLAVLFGQ